MTQLALEMQTGSFEVVVHGIVRGCVNESGLIAVLGGTVGDEMRVMRQTAGQRSRSAAAALIVGVGVEQLGRPSLLAS